jgi:malate dehydrogenase
MVPLPRLTTVGGVPLTSLLPKARIDEIVDRTRNGGAEIVKYLKTGSAYYAPAAAAVEMVLSGEYGERDLYMGVPVVIGRKGVEKILEMPLNDEEKAMFKNSVEAVRSTVAATKL